MEISLSNRHSARGPRHHWPAIVSFCERFRIRRRYQVLAKHLAKHTNGMKRACKGHYYLSRRRETKKTNRERRYREARLNCRKDKKSREMENLSGISKSRKSNVKVIRGNFFLFIVLLKFWVLQLMMCKGEDGWWLRNLLVFCWFRRSFIIRAHTWSPFVTRLISSFSRS